MPIGFVACGRAPENLATLKISSPAILLAYGKKADTIKQLEQIFKQRELVL
jgi:hypothetical protein